MENLKSVEKAAEFLGISPWTVRVYLRDKKLPAVRIGRRVLFRQEDLTQFVEDRVNAPTAESLKPA
jgi:excisionase family DNA binding protein